MNKKKLLLAILIVFISILIIGGWFIGDYFYNIALNPNADRSVILEAEHNQLGNDNSQGNQGPKINWLDEIDYQDASIQSEDQLKLHSYVIENETNSNVWVIVVHGYSGQGYQMGNLAKIYYEMGYNVLLPDARGHGQSEGNYIGMGWDDRLYIIAWIHYINETYSNPDIILYGVSMGGATVLMVSGEPLPDNVKLIIEDCGYTSAKAEFSYQLQETFGLPAFPIMDFANIVTQIKAGYSLDDASALKQVEKATIPILFIHGDADTFVPTKMVYKLYEAANTEKELLIIPNAGHGAASTVDPELYWYTVINFINTHLDN